MFLQAFFYSCRPLLAFIWGNDIGLEASLAVTSNSAANRAPVLQSGRITEIDRVISDIRV